MSISRGDIDTTSFDTNSDDNVEYSIESQEDLSYIYDSSAPVAKQKCMIDACTKFSEIENSMRQLIAIEFDVYNFEDTKLRFESLMKEYSEYYDSISGLFVFNENDTNIEQAVKLCDVTLIKSHTSDIDSLICVMKDKIEKAAAGISLETKQMMKQQTLLWKKFSK